MNFVFHLVPGSLVGTTLYPLNQLRLVHAEVAATYLDKYAGREALLTRRIPPLNCLWNDVLMFSPVHPATITQIFHDAGIAIKPRRWFQIPLNRLDESLCAVYYSSAWKGGMFENRPNSFKPLSDVAFDSLTQFPAGLVEHIQTARAKGRRPAMFQNVPHIMYHGHLDLNEIEIIEH